jgi:hypothetical protein
VFPSHFVLHITGITTFKLAQNLKAFSGRVSRKQSVGCFDGFSLFHFPLFMDVEEYASKND